MDLPEVAIGYSADVGRAVVDNITEGSVASGDTRITGFTLVTNLVVEGSRMAGDVFGWLVVTIVI